MPIKIRALQAGPKNFTRKSGTTASNKAMSDAARNKIARAMKKAAKNAAPGGRLSDQDITRAINALRGMIPSVKKGPK